SEPAVELHRPPVHPHGRRPRDRLDHHGAAVLRHGVQGRKLRRGCGLRRHPGRGARRVRRPLRPAHPEGGDPMNRTRIFSRTALAIALIGWLAVILGPYVVMLATSVTPNEVLTRSGASLVPPEISFEGYRQLLTGTAFLSYLRNSLLVALIAV